MNYTLIAAIILATGSIIAAAIGIGTLNTLKQMDDDISDLWDNYDDDHILANPELYPHDDNIAWDDYNEPLEDE